MWRTVNRGKNRTNKTGKKSKNAQRLSHVQLEQLEQRELLDGGLRHVFGTAVALQPGERQITNATQFSTQTGFGWQQGVVQTQAEHAFTTGGTFAVNVPKGQYQVTVALGDPSSLRDAVAVYLENNQAGLVTTTPGQLTTVTRTVTVNDGQLNLRLIDLGGANVGASIRRFDILPVTPPGPGVSTPATFNFASASSVLPAGQTRVSQSTTYNASTMYGWTSGIITAAPTHVFTSGAFFAADLPIGSYTIDVTLGDPSAKRDRMAVFLESDHAGTVTTLAGQTQTVSKTVKVLDGRLNVRLADLGGDNVGIAIQKIVIRPVSTTPTPPPLSGTFSGPPSAGEGSSANVSFSNVSGGQGNYTYSYDFDNNGTFEITGSNQATAVVPSSYLDDGPGTRVARGRITDGSGAFKDFTTSIPITNVAPTVTMTAPASGVANTAVSFSGSATDPSSADTRAGFTFAWEFGDGKTATGTSVSNTYTTAGTYTVKLTVTDKDGGQSSKSSSITISAVTPPFSNVTFSGPATAVNEGSTATVSFAGGQTGYTYSYDYNNDGTFEVTGSVQSSAVVGASYLDDGPGSRVVRGRVQDASGAFRDLTTTITINNVAPSASISAPATGTAGTAITFGGSAADPSNADKQAGFTYSWDFGDGTTGTGASVSHTFASAGTYTVRVTATDKDGGKNTASATVAIGTPSTTVQVIDDGETGFSTTGAWTTWTGTGPYLNDQRYISTGDGSAKTNWTFTVTPGRYRVSATWLHWVNRATDSPFTILDGTTALRTVRVNQQVAPNDFTASGATWENLADVNVVGNTLVVQLANNATGQYVMADGIRIERLGDAVVSLGNNGPVQEGSTATVTFTGAPTGSTFSYDYNNDGTFEVTGSSQASSVVAASYLDDGPGSRIVRGRVTTPTGTSTDYTTTITINNVAPTATLTAPSSGVVNTAVSLSSSATDPSTADTNAGFTYAWDFGDNTTGSGRTVDHTYATAGTYTIKLTVTDKDGGQASKSSVITISSPSSNLNNVTFSGPATAVNEGSTATVSFAGGQTGYTYSYDYNNDGTFEVTGSVQSSAVVGASYLDDGPGSRVVRGRVQDASGAFRDLTTTITINNVAPSASISAPSSMLTGVAANFSASASDASTADTQAGLTYAWNFGDGTTGSGQFVSHSFAAVGSYTVSLKVTDKDGGQVTITKAVTVAAPAPGGEFILVGQEKIPNFGSNPTIVSARSGSWSDPATWAQGRLPTTGDVVSVAANMTVSYDVVSDSPVTTVVVQAGGHLVFRTDINTRLTVKNLLVLEGGELQIGTSANPVASNVKAEVVFANLALDLTRDPEQYGNGLIGLGKVTMHGAVKSDSFVRLAVEPRAGDTTLTLAQGVTGWQVGDKVVLPDTRQLRWSERAPNYVPQWEVMTISAVSTDGKVITLSAALKFDHRGARNGDGVLEFLPHVGNLTRNVSIRSASAVGVRGHTLFAQRADVDIRYAGFSGLGRTKNETIDSTTFDANGQVTHLGTNQIGRYPVHFHHLMGPGGTPANGYQYTFVGNAVVCPLDPMPFRWGIAIHDSHFGLIKDNVLYNWAGAGIMTESGNETQNVIERNFVIRVSGTGLRADNGVNGSQGYGIWLSGPNNVVRDNVVTNIGNGSDSSYFGYALYFRHKGTQPIPNYKGASTLVAGQYTMRQINTTPILEFARNEVYGATANGFTYWDVNAENVTPLNGPGSTLKDLRVWHHHQLAAFAYESNKLTVDGFVARGDTTQRADLNPVGFYIGDYMAKDFTLRNADIQNLSSGFGVSTATGGGTQTVENSYFRNAMNVGMETMWFNGGSSDWIKPRVTIINNVKFAAPVGLPLRAIVLNTWDDQAELDNKIMNLVQKDEVYVYNYNQVPGDNFRVYYLEQAADYVLPQSRYWPDGSKRVSGSPVAGLTNQEAWAAYGIALAGAVAPSTARTRDGITGLVNPM